MNVFAGEPAPGFPGDGIGGSGPLPPLGFGEERNAPASTTATTRIAPPAIAAVGIPAPFDAAAFLPQQRLYFSPLPQGQGAFLGTWGVVIRRC